MKRPPSLLMISSTPIVRPRETSGAHRIERVSNCVRGVDLAREARVARGVVDDRGLAGLRPPSPATPSPILRRKARDVAGPWRRARPRTPAPASPRPPSAATTPRRGSAARIFSITSSITLRGSRIELAVFTTSVRIASRRAVVCVPPAPPRAAGPARRAPRRRAGGRAPPPGRGRPAAKPRPGSRASSRDRRRERRLRRGRSRARRPAGRAARGARRRSGPRRGRGGPTSTSAAAKRAGSSRRAAGPSGGTNS